MTDSTPISKTADVERDALIGRRLLGIKQTSWSDPVCHLEGIGDAYYCTVVLEMESGCFVLADESIGPWESQEALQEAKLDEHQLETEGTPLGQRVSAVVVDQTDELTVVLENGVYLAINSGYGWHLQIGDIADLLRDNIDGEPFKFVDWWQGEPVDLSPFAQMQSAKPVGQAVGNRSSERTASSKNAERKYRLKVFESNFGREYGWHVEVNGEQIAQLTEPKQTDMFWHEYRLEPLTDDPDKLALLGSDEFWGKCPTLRNREFGEFAEGAFPGGLDNALERGRISYRSDSIVISPPTAWEKVLLWWRKGRSC